MTSFHTGSRWWVPWQLMCQCQLRAPNFFGTSVKLSKIHTCSYSPCVPIVPRRCRCVVQRARKLFVCAFKEMLDLVVEVDEDFAKSKNTFAKWQDQALEMRDKMHVQPGTLGWVHTHGLEKLPRTDRIMETVEIAYFAAQNKAVETGRELHSVLDEWCVEPGCSIYRKPWGTCFETIGQRALPYMFRHERTMTTKDRLLGPLRKCNHQRAGFKAWQIHSTTYLEWSCINGSLHHAGGTVHLRL